MALSQRRIVRTVICNIVAPVDMPVAEVQNLVAMGSNMVLETNCYVMAADGDTDIGTQQVLGAVSSSAVDCGTGIHDTAVDLSLLAACVNGALAAGITPLSGKAAEKYVDRVL